MPSHTTEEQAHIYDLFQQIMGFPVDEDDIDAVLESIGVSGTGASLIELLEGSLDDPDSELGSIFAANLEQDSGSQSVPFDYAPEVESPDGGPPTSGNRQVGGEADKKKQDAWKVYTDWVRDRTGYDLNQPVTSQRLGEFLAHHEGQFSKSLSVANSKGAEYTPASVSSWAFANAGNEKVAFSFVEYFEIPEAAPETVSAAEKKAARREVFDEWVTQVNNGLDPRTLPLNAELQGVSVKDYLANLDELFDGASKEFNTTGTSSEDDFFSFIDRYFRTTENRRDLAVTPEEFSDAEVIRKRKVADAEAAAAYTASQQEKRRLENEADEALTQRNADWQDSALKEAKRLGLLDASSSPERVQQVLAMIDSLEKEVGSAMAAGLPIDYASRMQLRFSEANLAVKQMEHAEEFGNFSDLTDEILQAQNAVELAGLVDKQSSGVELSDDQQVRLDALTIDDDEITAAHEKYSLDYAAGIAAGKNPEEAAAAAMKAFGIATGKVLPSGTVLGGGFGAPTNQLLAQDLYEEPLDAAAQKFFDQLVKNAQADGRTIGEEEMAFLEDFAGRQDEFRAEYEVVQQASVASAEDTLASGIRTGAVGVNQTGPGLSEEGGQAAFSLFSNVPTFTEYMEGKFLTPERVDPGEMTDEEKAILASGGGGLVSGTPEHEAYNAAVRKQSQRDNLGNPRQIDKNNAGYQDFVKQRDSQAAEEASLRGRPRRARAAAARRRF